jgi:hypothetical protein
MQMVKKRKLVLVLGPLKIANAASARKQMSVKSGGML